MRIAIYHNLPSGGGKRSLLEMVKRLAGRHEIDVYTLSSAEHNFCDLRPLAAKHRVWPFKPARLLRSPFGRLNQLIYLWDMLRLDRLDQRIGREIDTSGYDVAFIHHCRYRQSPAILRFLQTPSVYYCQEPPRWIYDPPAQRPYLVSPWERPWHMRVDPLPKLYRKALQDRDAQNVRLARVVMVNSYHSKEQVWRVYGKEPLVCYLGVDTNVFRPMPVQREPRILSVGATSPIKGYDLLIQGLGRLPAAERLPLVIISNSGFAAEENYLHRLAERAGVQMEIVPLVTDSRSMAEWYSRSLLTGYTPMLEPLGLVALESMACGTPVLGVCEGGVRETVVDGVTGRLVDRDPDAVAQGLHDMLRQPELLTGMGIRARAVVSEKWSWEESVARIECHLEKATH